MAKQRCFSCGGTGEIQDPGKIVERHGGSVVYGKKTCFGCGGTGYIEDFQPE